MPILFYAPWALFCTLAGYLADRYSKRNSLVFWKFAEVAITLIALLGFWLGRHDVAFGPYLVLSTVFLMGTHSAFFVPAKYGAMPEILQPHMLSRGNGVLESLSFLAVILGTVMGGVLSHVFRGQEYYIGLILVALAVLGALASLLIRRMPAANPNRPFPPYLYQPLVAKHPHPAAFAAAGPGRRRHRLLHLHRRLHAVDHVHARPDAACRPGTRRRPAKSSAWWRWASASAVRWSASCPAARSSWAWCPSAPWA